MTIWQARALFFVCILTLLAAASDPWLHFADLISGIELGAAQTTPQDSSAAQSASAALPLLTTSAEINVVNQMLAPLIQEAGRRRAARVRNEPQTYAARVDKQLNQNRINFLVFGYGTTYEPPLPPQYKGSIAIYSLDLRTLQISTVTLNHDIRAPEVESYIRSTGRDPQPTKIHFAYPTGGFDLMRLVTEDATGFSVDFQLAFQDSVVKQAVDDVFGGLSVDVPFAFDAQAIYFQDVRYPPKQYARGRQRMNGLEVLQFIKAVQSQGIPYAAGKELAIRKQIVVQAMLNAVKTEATNPIFWGKVYAFLNATAQQKEVEYDFDAAALLFKSIGSYASQAAKGQALRLSLGKSLYIVDAGLGDGGVEWVMGSANPLMVSDLKKGLYDADKYLSVPLGSADPYAADLVRSYWPSIRQLIRQRLIH